MLRLSFSLSYVGVLLLLSFTSCQAQTVSRCRPTPPMPKNPKPGVIGLSLQPRRKNARDCGNGWALLEFGILVSGQMLRTLPGIQNSIYKAEFSPNEKLIASSSRDLTARLGFRYGARTL